MIDDSGLFHGDYDPAYAREYYLRTRKLKGRERKAEVSSVSSPSKKFKSGPVQVHQGQKPKAPKAASRRAELQKQKERLEARLDVLRDVLEQAVEAAQARSGVKKNSAEKAKAAPESKSAKTAKSKANSSKDKPETASQKRERAKKAKEAYEKENRITLSDDVEILKKQIEDIKEKIMKALEQARTKNQGKTAGVKSAAFVRPKTDNPSGPRGR